MPQGRSVTARALSAIQLNNVLSDRTACTGTGVLTATEKGRSDWPFQVVFPRQQPHARSIRKWISWSVGLSVMLYAQYHANFEEPILLFCSALFCRVFRYWSVSAIRLPAKHSKIGAKVLTMLPNPHTCEDLPAFSFLLHQFRRCRHLDVCG